MSYDNIRARVSGFDVVNNLDAFESTRLCGQGFEMYGTLYGGCLFLVVANYVKDSRLRSSRLVALIDIVVERIFISARFRLLRTFSTKVN